MIVPDSAAPNVRSRATWLYRGLIVAAVAVAALLAGGAWLVVRYPAARADALVALIAREGPAAGYRELAYPYRRGITPEAFAAFAERSGLSGVTGSTWQRDTLGRALRRGWRYRVEGDLTLRDGRRVPAAMVLGRPCGTCPSAAIWDLQIDGQRPEQTAAPR